MRNAFGVPSDLFGLLKGRQTYVIDKAGVVQLCFNSQFEPEKHVAQALEMLEELGESEPKKFFGLF